MSRGQFWGAAALLLLFALALRIALAPGIDGSDGLNYNLHAHRLLLGDTAPIRHVTSIRYLLIVPLAISMQLFGVGDVASALPVLAYGAAQLILVFFIALQLGGSGHPVLPPHSPRPGDPGRPLALASLALAAILPLSVFDSTDLHVDLPMAVFQGLAVLCALHGARSERRARLLWFAAGLSAGGAHLAKEPGSLILVVLAVIATRRDLIPLAAGFLVVVIGEAAFFQLATGDPLFRITTILHYGHRDAVLSERYSPTPYRWMLDYPATLFVPASRNFLYLGGLAYPAMFEMARSFRRNPLAIWLAGIFLMMNFLPADLGFRHPAQVHFARTLSFLTIPLCILASAWLLELSRTRRPIAIALAIFIGASCLAATSFIQLDAAARVSGLREAAGFLKARPDSKIYSDPRSAKILEYYFGYERTVEPFPKSAPSSPSLLVEDQRAMSLAGIYGYRRPEWVDEAMAERAIFEAQPSTRIVER